MDETEVTPEALFELRNAAYAQWEEAGLYVWTKNAPMERYFRHLSKSLVFVAHDTATGELLAMHTFRKDNQKDFIWGGSLAVAPMVKHEGIASQMLQEEVKRFITAGYRYLCGSTAIPATWSVKWHLKNGYYINGYEQIENRNYASYTFCKPINLDIRHHPKDILWLRPIAPLTARIQYIVSYIITRLKHSRKLSLLRRKLIRL